MSLAEACCRLLPFRHEIFHLADKTEHLLRNPDIWQAVIRLADLLETKEPLETERLLGFLPNARPHWPPTSEKQAMLVGLSPWLGVSSCSVRNTGAAVSSTTWSRSCKGKLGAVLNRVRQPDSRGVREVVLHGVNSYCQIECQCATPWFQ